MKTRIRASLNHDEVLQVLTDHFNEKFMTNAIISDRVRLRLREGRAEDRGGDAVEPRIEEVWVEFDR